MATAVFIIVLAGALYVTLNLSGQFTSTTTSSETVSSTNSSVVPISQNSNISRSCLAYVPVVISNQQNESTPVPFQQMLVINSQNYSAYINQNWSNVEFTSGINCSGTALQAWVENNASSSSKMTTVWIALTTNVAAQNNITIYMDFMSTQVMSSKGPTGEAPQLSDIYGQFDNGALVFPFYDNFSGTSLSDQWTEGGNIAPSGVGYIGGNFSDKPAVVNNSLTVHYNGTNFGNAQWDWVQSVSSFNPQKNVMDADAYFSGLTNGGTEQQLGWGSETNSSFQYYISDGNLEYNGSNPITGYYVLLANPGYHTTLLNGSTSGFQVFSIWSDPIGRAYATTNYLDEVVANGNSPTTYAFLRFAENNGSPYSIIVQWTRVRALPPNGVMPSVYFDSIHA